MMVCVPAFAAESSNNDTEKFNVNIYSEEYPNAYIEQSFSPAKNILNGSNSSKVLVGTVNATVYVEEKYDTVNGKKICTSSKLLSKSEVNQIGKDKFNDISTNDVIEPSDSDSKGRLHLFFELYRNWDTDYAIEYQPSCTATWTWPDLTTGKNTPAAGDDFLGFVWGGNYDYNLESITAVDDSGNKRDTYSADSQPNKGHVWGFLEGPEYYGDRSYTKSIGAGLTMFKNKLTGGGNTTSFVCKYIHTYQEETGSINISTSGVGFSLSGTSKQWSLITRISSRPY
ncbi:hypothetical protein CAFE_17370 [Caprobacter fermentans]|uniref:Uncharacterized protein n=2 Tax=Caproicibacter TaxID=2576755 RepID=A0A6N8HZL7_9FIRM|nr:hypothetical protein [Caproicibacter fermentans]OCN01731.1 hypothetical protein A7X67_01180 [Clostridium sp. W14A]